MSDRRIYFRVSAEEEEAILRACQVAGISKGSMGRICTLNWCAFVAAEMTAAGRDFGKVRRPNGSEPS